MGQHNADTLVGYLPPVGWADVATKADLDVLRAEFRGELEALRGDLARSEASFERVLRAQTVWIIGALFASVALAVSLSQLLS